MINTGKNSDMHPNSLEALAPHKWKPGESGNPAGRPPRTTLAMLTAKVCAKRVPSDILNKTELAEDEIVKELKEENDLTLGSLFVYLEVRKALGGDDKAAERIWKYGSGLTLGILEVEHGLNPVDREFLRQCFESYEESQAAESDSETQSGLS